VQEGDPFDKLFQMSSLICTEFTSHRNSLGTPYFLLRIPPKRAICDKQPFVYNWYKLKLTEII